MDKIKRFLECLVPVTVCNLKCNYCYVIQENRRTEKLPEFLYSPQHIGKALSVERLGGICYVSICGAGETLIPEEMADIIRCILEEGHYVNITTNGTMTKRFDEIIRFPQKLLKRLHFAFSLHYLELARINKINAFFSNVKKVKDAGCSFLIQFNLCDIYLPYLDEIRSLCEQRVGAVPQVAPTRNECTKRITLLTSHSDSEYRQFGSQFKSPLFDFVMKNFMVKREEFCYAGDWSFLLDLSNGEMRKCYASSPKQNIFEDLNRPIVFRALGNNCRSPHCGNSSHFMSLGVIPSILTPTYADLRNRSEAGWYNFQMRAFLNSKLCDSNKEYNKLQKLSANINEFLDWFPQRIINKVKRLA